MRKYRCPWCGEEVITLPGKVFVGSNFNRGRRCPACTREYAHKSKISFVLQVLKFWSFYLFGNLILFLIPFFRENYFIIIWLDTFSFIFLVGLGNYLFAKLVRWEDGQIIPFEFQGSVEIEAYRKYKRRIKDGDILAACFEGSAFPKADEEFPFVLSAVTAHNQIQGYQIGFIKYEFIPKGLVTAGAEFTIRDNGKAIGKGVITRMYETFDQQETN